MKDSDPAVVVEQRYEVPPEKVWSAITVLEQMQAWYFSEVSEFEPRVGFETSFSLEHDGATYVHQWKLMEVEPKKRLVYDWTYQGLPGRGEVVWELTADGEGTVLRLTNKVLESFPQDDPAFKRESCVAGWTYFLEEQLKDFLEG